MLIEIFKIIVNKHQKNIKEWKTFLRTYTQFFDGKQKFFLRILRILQRIWTTLKLESLKSNCQHCFWANNELNLTFFS